MNMQGTYNVRQNLLPQFLSTERYKFLKNNRIQFAEYILPVLFGTGARYFPNVNK